MPRLLALLLALSAAGCGVLAPFDADRGDFSATVRGAETFDLDGSAYLTLASDLPPATSVLLTGTDEPAIEATVAAGALRVGTYAIPTEATATFERSRYDGRPYVGTAGTLRVTRVGDGEAEGTLSFTAARGGAEVAVEATFTAEEG